jgi:hypothetical protein
MDPISVTQAEQPAPAASTLEQLLAAQNFNLAVAAGIAAALVGAILWAIVTVVTKASWA